jgi:hypothetical protein
MGPSVGNDGVMSYWLDFAMPEQAGKTWENLREKLVQITDDDVKIKATNWETLDPGNYSPGTGMSRVSVMAAAKEHGDDELAAALEMSLDKRYRVVRKNGARAYTGISSWGNAGHVMARFTTENAMADLMAVADTGEVMPPKSTWFEPKLADGLVSLVGLRVDGPRATVELRGDVASLEKFNLFSTRLLEAGVASVQLQRHEPVERARGQRLAFVASVQWKP